MILSPRDALLFSIASQAPGVAALSVPIREDLLRRISLREYQLNLLRRAAAAMAAGARRVLIQLPTGGGKTRMAAALLNSVCSLGFGGQFLVHRKELIDQTSDSFTELGLRHGFVASKRPMDLSNSLLIAGVQTLANRLDVVLPPRLGVIDEAHHATAETWARVMEAYGDSWIIGLTATPERLDGRGLDEHFDVLIEGPSVAWLIAKKFLSPYEYFAPDRPDMSGVDDMAGDYSRTGAAAVMDRPKLIGDFVEHYLRLAPGERGIVFAVNRQHSQHLAEAFNGAGIPTAHIDSTMDAERDAAMKAFRGHDLTLLTNVDLLGEGVDVPDISYVGLGRPTKSLSLHRQQIGRNLRTAEGKLRGIIADHAGNAFVHGLPDDEVTWSLKGRVGRTRGNPNDDAAPVRQCLVCYRISPSKVKVCPGCGTETSPNPRQIEIEAGQLKKLEREQAKVASAEEKKRAARRRRLEEQACKSKAALIELAKSRGYEFPAAWAERKISQRRQFAKRFGR